MNKLSVPIYLKKKRDFTTMGEEKKYSTEEKCYLKVHKREIFYGSDFEIFTFS